MRWRSSDASRGDTEGPIGRPATSARPALGARRVASTRTVVVLPAPLGPRNPKISPASTSKERSSKATREPKRFVSPSATMTGRFAMLTSTLIAGRTPDRAPYGAPGKLPHLQHLRDPHAQDEPDVDRHPDGQACDDPGEGPGQADPQRIRDRVRCDIGDGGRDEPGEAQPDEGPSHLCLG